MTKLPGASFWLPALLLALVVASDNSTIALPEPNSPFVAFNIWVKSGSAADPKGKEGLASLTATLMAGGATRQDTLEAILEKMYPMSAGYSVSVDKEMTNFTGRVHRDNLDAYYALFKNALLAPAFSEADFNRVKSQRLNFLERGRRYSRDEELSKDLLFSMAYEGTPYQHPSDGYVESVRSITLDDMRGFYRDHYVRNNIVVGVGGGYSQGFAERVRKDLDALPEGTPRAIPAPMPKAPSGVKVLIVDKQTDASAISFGFPITLLRNHPDFVPLLVANSYLGEHRNSVGRLYQAIRETRGMNYGNYAYIEAFPAGYATQQPRVNVASAQPVVRNLDSSNLADGARQPPRPDALRHARGDVRVTEAGGEGNDAAGSGDIEGVPPQLRRHLGRHDQPSSRLCG